MMCDSVEAAIKSLEKPDNHKIDLFVENIIDKQMKMINLSIAIYFNNISVLSILKDNEKHLSC